MGTQDLSFTRWAQQYDRGFLDQRRAALAVAGADLRWFVGDFLCLDTPLYQTYYDWQCRLPYDHVEWPNRPDAVFLRVVHSGLRFFRSEYFWCWTEGDDIYDRLQRQPDRDILVPLHTAHNRLEAEASITLKAFKEKGLTPMARAKGTKPRVDTGALPALREAAATFQQQLVTSYPDVAKRMALINAVTDQIMKQPHVLEMDWLGAREIARLSVQLEELDAIGTAYRDASYGHLRARLSRRLEEWMEQYGLTPMARARIRRLKA